jgi:hypothetical protein
MAPVDPNRLPPVGRAPAAPAKPAAAPQKPPGPVSPGPGWHGKESWSAVPRDSRSGANSAAVKSAPVKADSSVSVRDPTATSGDDSLAGLGVHGDKGMQSLEMWLNIAEPMTVGENDVPEAVARTRALDVDNRELLDFATNQKTQGRGVPMEPVPPARSPVSVTQDPSALVTRRFSEITEMRSIFDEAVAGIKDPDSLKPTQLKKRINAKVWELIKAGASPEAARVRTALRTIGAENVPGKGYRLRLAPPPQPQLPSQPENPSAAGPGGKLVGRTIAVAGGAALAGDVLVQLHEGRPVEAAKTAAIGSGAMYALGKVPALAPLAVMWSTISASKDPKIRDDAFAAGDWVAEKTHPIVGAVAAASVATGESVYEGTFGVTGRAIGEGAAVVYIRATSDEYTFKPWDSQLWADVFGD